MMVSTVLATIRDFVHFGNRTSRKPIVFMHNLVYCIFRNSLFIRNDLYCNSSLSQNESINRTPHSESIHHCGPTRPVFIFDTILLYRPSLREITLFVNFFFTEKCFSVHIIHTSINFQEFGLLSHQWSDGRPLFKLGELFDLTSF